MRFATERGILTDPPCGEHSNRRGRDNAQCQYLNHSPHGYTLCSIRKALSPRAAI